MQLMLFFLQNFGHSGTWDLRFRGLGVRNILDGFFATSS